MFLHFLSAYGRNCLADTGVKHTEIIVNLGRGTYRASWIAGIHLLLDGDGRGQAGDVIALRLLHAAEKLTGIGRQTLHVAPLPFGV